MMTDPISSLKALADLRDAGVITEEEFQTKKQIVLARIEPSTERPVAMRPLAAPVQAPPKSSPPVGQAIARRWRSLSGRAKVFTIVGVVVGLGLLGNLGRSSGDGVEPTGDPGGVAAAAIRFVSPEDGATVRGRSVVVSGSAPPGARIIFDVPLGTDLHTTAGDSGAWSMSVRLKEGENELRFRIGDDQTTTATLRVTYIPTPTPDPTPTRPPTPAPTPSPTAEPTPPPTPISYATLSSREWALVVKDPDSYLGEAYQVWACISQFDAATGSDSFRAQASYRQEEYWFSDGSNALFSGLESDLATFVQDDVVFMRVLAFGSFSYDTQIGGNTTVPLFFVNTIELKGSC